MSTQSRLCFKTIQGGLQLSTGFPMQLIKIKSQFCDFFVDTFRRAASIPCLLEATRAKGVSYRVGDPVHKCGNKVNHLTRELGNLCDSN